MSRKHASLNDGSYTMRDQLLSKLGPVAYGQLIKRAKSSDNRLYIPTNIV